MTAHTQSELQPQTGLAEAKVRRIICVVVSIVAVSAGSVISTAEPSRRRVGSTIPVTASTKVAVVVPHLPESGRSFADTRHETVAKPARSRASPENVFSRTIVAAAGTPEDGLARVAQTRTIPGPAD